jgi:amino acid adenylation domain-containing protein
MIFLKPGGTLERNQIQSDGKNVPGSPGCVGEKQPLVDPEGLGQSTLMDLIQRQMTLRPDELALSTLHEKQVVTYGELDSWSKAVAAGLSQAGVGCGAKVGVYSSRRPDCISALLGVMRSGAAYVPVDVSAPIERTQMMFEEAELRHVICDEATIHRIPPGPWQVIAIHEFARDCAATTPSVEHGKDELAYVLFTSGSSGTPKGVEITKGNLANYVQWAAKAYGFRPGGRALVQSPLTFDLTVTTLFCPLIVGGTVVLVDDDHPAAVASFLASGGGYDVVKITPAHLEWLSRQLNRDQFVGVARTVVVGGEALFARQLDSWRQADHTTTFVNEYGPTEATVGCMAHWLTEQDGDGPVPIGYPVANATIALLDSNGREVAAGSIGEIYIGGPGVARGYTRPRTETTTGFVDDPLRGRLYRTGDLAREGASGLVYVGRIDEQLKIRGHRVELSEIEGTVLRHPDVRAAAVGAPERRSGDCRLVAYVVPEAKPVAADQMREYLALSLPEYMIPAAFVWLEELPMNRNGKLDRRALPTPGKERPLLNEEYVSARSALEVSLVHIMADVLELCTVGINDNFFDLGGDSLAGAEVVMRVCEELGTEIELSDLFDQPTVTEFARRIESADGSRLLS